MLFKWVQQTNSCSFEILARSYVYKLYIYIYIYKDNLAVITMVDMP